MCVEGHRRDVLIRTTSEKFVGLKNYFVGLLYVSSPLHFVEFDEFSLVTTYQVGLLHVS